MAEARTPAADALSLLSYQVLRLGHVLTTVGDRLSQPSGQSSARWLVLAAVENEARSVAQVARRLGLSRQNVQRIADTLVEGGFARYQDNPAHRRAKLLSLSTTGHRALSDIQARQAAWANAVGAGLDEAELLQAVAALGRVHEALLASDEAEVSAG